ncbi:MAG TPA: DUF4386 domain-containing protein [Anaerolineales bacterium]|nr:DUF4386 domain-containing protein [Anaerolineales bacterium]HNH77679.1 DUF4386 domain-containing protein [Anaerolineales bacterium]
MSEKTFRKLAGIFFIVGAILVNIPYTLLIINFDYPDILRLPAAEILTRFQAGGSSLIYTWLAFAWVGLPMLLGAIMLKRILADENAPFLETATTLGVIGFIVQVVGLLRWVFVVPVLARLFTDPTTDPVTKAALPLVFSAVHQYGGVILGEHLGQFLIILWMSMLSGILYKSKRFSKWVAYLGWIASAVYILAQTELLATAIPSFPVIGWAGLYGSLLWLLWMIVVGVYLVKES